MDFQSVSLRRALVGFSRSGVGVEGRRDDVALTHSAVRALETVTWPDQTEAVASGDRERHRWKDLTVNLTQSAATSDPFLQSHSGCGQSTMSDPVPADEESEVGPSTALGRGGMEGSKKAGTGVGKERGDSEERGAFEQPV